MVIFETDECFENQDLQKPSDLADSQFSFECETCEKMQTSEKCLNTLILSQRQQNKTRELPNK